MTQSQTPRLCALECCAIGAQSLGAQSLDAQSAMPAAPGAPGARCAPARWLQP